MTDFGFTSVVRGDDSVLVTQVQGYTARWAAPEVLSSGDRYTREADIFSFAMVVIEVGHCPSPTPRSGKADLTPASHLRSLPESIRSASAQPQ